MPAIARAGVRFVGIHLISNLSAEKIERAVRLCDAAKRNDLEPVILTKEMDLELIGQIIERTQTRWIQLHAPWRVEMLLRLRDRFPLDRLSLIHLIPPEVRNDGRYIERISAIADYLIVDRAEGGTGRPLAESDLRDLMQQVPADRTFLAGGLTPQNVAHVVKSYRPFAVDVQSGVLGVEGDQDIGLVDRFARAVAGVAEPLA
jgi:phosphoribosylanthranilate isomerase